MFPFDIPNVFRSILTGDFWSTKATDTDTKVTVSCKGLFYWHSDIFIRLRITVKIGKLHSVSLLEMRLLGNWHESSNLSVSAKIFEVTPISWTSVPLMGVYACYYFFNTQTNVRKRAMKIVRHRTETVIDRS